MQAEQPKEPHDTHEEGLVQLFCTGEALQRCLASFCKDSQGQQDPVLHVLLLAMTSHVQIQLTVVGLQLFHAGELTLPYYRMTPEQRAFLLDLTYMDTKWNVHENSMSWKRKGKTIVLPTVDVLQAMCMQILATRKAYPDAKSRVAICNIVLQRVQASTPLSQALQAELNARLFPETEREDPAREATPAI